MKNCEVCGGPNQSWATECKYCSTGFEQTREAPRVQSYYADVGDGGMAVQGDNNKVFGAGSSNVGKRIPGKAGWVTVYPSSDGKSCFLSGVEAGYSDYAFDMSAQRLADVFLRLGQRAVWADDGSYFRVTTTPIYLSQLEIDFGGVEITS